MQQKEEWVQKAASIKMSSPWIYFRIISKIKLIVSLKRNVFLVLQGYKNLSVSISTILVTTLIVSHCSFLLSELFHGKDQEKKKEKEKKEKKGEKKKKTRLND